MVWKVGYNLEKPLMNWPYCDHSISLWVSTWAASRQTFLISGYWISGWKNCFSIFDNLPSQWFQTNQYGTSANDWISTDEKQKYRIVANVIISHLFIFPSSKWPLSGSRKRCNDLNTRRYLCIITVTPIKLNTLGNTLPTNSKKWLAKLESDTRMALITLVILMRTNALTMVYFKSMICIPYIGASVTPLNSWRISLSVF